MALTGRWSPGGFPPWITLCAKIVLLILMVTRGVDYLTGDTADTARRLSSIEAAAPLWVWGAVLTVAGGAGFAAMLARRAAPLVWVHTCGAAVYAALSTGIAVDVHARADSLPLAALLLVVPGAIVVWAAHLRAQWEHTPTILAGAALATVTAFAASDLDGIRNAAILAGVAALHALMATGTAATLRQEAIISRRDGG